MFLRLQEHTEASALVRVRACKTVLVSLDSAAARAPGNASGRATRELLMITAERLFADRGIHGVSLREIGLAAGQRNNNVIAYHFASREGLVAAIYAYRSEGINRRRLELLNDAAGDLEAGDIRVPIRVLVQPHAETIGDPDNHFVGFLARLLLDMGSIANPESEAALPYMSAHILLRRRIRTFVSHLRAPEFRRRYDLLFNLAITACAIRKRISPSIDAPGASVVLEEVVEAMAASLLAPPLKASLSQGGRRTPPK